MSDVFDYAEFIVLQHTRLVEYMDPILASGKLLVNARDVNQLIADLPSFEPYHLSYALEIGSIVSPGLFAPLLPRYLSHSDIAVACAALNGLDRIPPLLLTKELVESVHTARPNSGIKQAAIALGERIEQRLCTDF